MDQNNLLFGIELFPINVQRERPQRMLSVSLDMASAPPPVLKTQDEEDGSRQIRIALFRNAVGRQLGGVRRLTAILRISSEPDHTLEQEIEELANYVAGSNEAEIDALLGGAAVTIPKSWDKIAARLAPKFLNRSNCLSRYIAPNYISEWNLLLASDEDIHLGGICLSTEDEKRFKQGEPVFISPLRLFDDVKNRRGAQANSSLENMAHDAVAVAIYRIKHAMSGLAKAQSSRTFDADTNANALLCALLEKHNQRVHRKPRQKGTDKNRLPDYTARAGKLLRALSGEAVKTDQLKLGRQMNLRGRNALKNFDALGKRLLADLEITGLLLARASLLRSDLEIFSNNKDNFQKPIATAERNLFAEPPSELLSDLFKRQNYLRLDPWSRVALYLGINPARFWPSAWPLVVYFDGVAGLGNAIRARHFDNITSEQQFGIRTVFQVRDNDSSALNQSKRVLNRILPSELKETYHQLYTEVGKRQFMPMDEEQERRVAKFLDMQDLKNSEKSDD